MIDHSSPLALRVLPLAVAVTLLACGRPASAESLTCDDIADAWNRRADAARLEWRYDTGGIYRFQHYQSDWVPRDRKAAEPAAALDIDRNRFRFDTLRWTAGEHGYIAAKINAAMVVEFYPERKQDWYVANLDAHFADADAEFRDPRPFRRAFDGTTLRDFWPPQSGDYPRGIVREALPAGEPSGRPSDARTKSDALQDLSLAGAILALYPQHACGFVRLTDGTLAAEPVLVDGDSCVVLFEASAAEPTVRRTLWLDPQRDFAIRRWIAASSSGGNQIDIRYRRDAALGWVPTEWTVSSFGEENGGRLDATRAIVTKFEPRGELADAETGIDYPPTTWVIDDPARKQYILRADRSQRDIHPLEFDWLPTYAELSATEPGQVGQLVERKLRWHGYWRSARYPALLGVATLASAGALSLWRRRRR